MGTEQEEGLRGHRDQVEEGFLGPELGPARREPLSPTLGFLLLGGVEHPDCSEPSEQMPHPPRASSFCPCSSSPSVGLSLGRSGALQCLRVMRCRVWVNRLAVHWAGIVSPEFMSTWNFRRRPCLRKGSLQTHLR